MPRSKMVIALSDSEPSRHALLQGLTFAGTDGRDIVVTTVVPAYRGDLRLYGHAEALDDERHRHERLLQEAHDVAGRTHIPVSARLVQGEPCEEILALAEAEGADLIVVGKTPCSALDVIPTGAVNGRVVTQSAVDVLVVPEKAYVEPLRLLLAYDGSLAAAAAADKAIRLAKRHGSELVVVTVCGLPAHSLAVATAAERDEKLQAEAKEILDRVLLKAAVLGVPSAEGVLRQGVPSEIIARVAKERNSGLIVMGSRGFGHLRKLLLGSTVADVICADIAPVLVVKQPVDFPD